MRSGHTTSCGCNKNQLEDLTGKRFDNLLVINRADDYVCPANQKHYVQWNCLCDCGKETIVLASNLKSGSMISCGCFNPHRLQDLSGRHFGKLKVIRQIDSYVNPSGRKLIQYECECNCGKHIKALANTLRTGDVTSCGCSVNSKGERITAEWLTQRNFEFETHKSFADCLSDDNYRLNFDFYLPTVNALIECNGIQHYEPIEFFGGYERYEVQKRHDAIKRNYAKRKGFSYLVLDCRRSKLPLIENELSIFFKTLGQEQQFTLILQTLQQLKDVYGDSVDKIVQGNTSNIVFLKSTDDAMIDTLQKMSGTTHKSFTDSKTITRDMQKLMMQNEGKASYTMTTKEVPVISYNDMAFISERNSIIFRAGDSPVWNRNETILPMSWRLFKNTIIQPGKDYSLQTIPTLSSALDFDIRQNQPDFMKMLDKRMAQAGKAVAAMDLYKSAYNYTDTELSKLDIDAYSDEIMDLITAMLNNSLGKGSANTADEDDMFDGDDVVSIDDWDDDMLEGNYSDSIDEINSYGMLNTDNIEENVDVQTEAARRQAQRDERDRKIYAGGYISKSMLVNPDGSVKSHSFDRDFSEIFANNMGSMLNDKQYFTEVDGNLYGINGKPYIVKADNKAMLERMNEAAQEEGSNVFSEENVAEQDLSEFNTYTITDAFYQFLASLDMWSFADGRFENEMRRRMEG